MRLSLPGMWRPLKTRLRPILNVRRPVYKRPAKDIGTGYRLGISGAT